jgi:hypothetical protein
VSPPPKDFYCILNESLWFNRFILDPDRNTRGRSFTKSIVDKLIKLGFTHVRDLLSTQVTDDKLWFMSHAEAESRTGSKVLANTITKKIFFLLPTWGLILHNKIREPFCTGDWFIDLNEPTPDSPLQIFRTTFVSENHLVGESFRFSNPSSNLLIKSTISVKILPISQCIKACVFNLQGKLFYYGNYLTSKLLLSRISWQCNDTKKTFFCDFSISSIYKALLFRKDKTIPALLRWERILSFSISSSWKSMLKYLHDPILENKTKEILFKIYSQVLPVGTNVEKFGYATTCFFCQQTEDEIHLFVTCPRISDLWIWLHNSVLCHYPTLINNQLSPWES